LSDLDRLTASRIDQVRNHIVYSGVLRTI